MSPNSTITFCLLLDNCYKIFHYKPQFINDFYNFSENPSTPEVADHIKIFTTYINKHKSLFDLEKIDSTRSVPLDVQNLQSDSDFSAGWPNFSNDLFEKPDNTLRLLEYCLHEVLLYYRIIFKILITS